MLREVTYNREKAVEYARIWAFARNPKYLDFENLGGDCTNFASQCLYAGAGVMNFTPTFGWFYRTSSNRTASWTGVMYLYNFLVGNKREGPYAIEVPKDEAQPGDLIQLGDPTGHFYHTPVIVAKSEDEIYVATHTSDSFMRPLSTYYYHTARFLHIAGVRKYN